MSDIGGPPQDPNAQPDPYGQPAPPPYGQPAPYGQPYAGVPYGSPAPVYAYAHWIKRVGATIIDALLAGLAAIPLWIGYGVLIAHSETHPDGTTTIDDPGLGLTLVVVGALTSLAFFIWNVFVRQGRTGYTIGKSVLDIKLVREADGQPVGAGMAFVRHLCHILDSFCYLGYLWPLWDPKKQTFADKIMGTLVIIQPQEQAQPRH